MSDDYQKGFKDGFAVGLEEGKKLVPKPTRLDDYLFGQPGYLGNPGTCQVCGRSGVAGYVCYDPKCPIKVTCGGTITGNTISGSFASEKEYDQRGWRIK